MIGVFEMSEEMRDRRNQEAAERLLALLELIEENPEIYPARTTE